MGLSYVSVKHRYRLRFWYIQAQIGICQTPTQLKLLKVVRFRSDFGKNKSDMICKRPAIVPHLEESESEKHGYIYF